MTTTAIRQRNQKIAARLAAGASLREVGGAFGISRERVRQIAVAAAELIRDGVERPFGLQPAPPDCASSGDACPLPRSASSWASRSTLSSAKRAVSACHRLASTGR